MQEIVLILLWSVAIYIYTSFIDIIFTVCYTIFIIKIINTVLVLHLIHFCDAAVLTVHGLSSA